MRFTTDEERREAAEKDKVKTVAMELPLRLGGELLVRSLVNPAEMAKCKLVGAIHGDFLLITEPVIRINDRLTAFIEGTFSCSYFTSGFLYAFQSRCRRLVMDGVMCIEYPTRWEIKQLRKHRRIRVNIETEFRGPAITTPLYADMTDISSGGCRLLFHPTVGLVQGMYGVITFTLPNEQLIRRMKCQVMNASHFKSRETTEVGVKFIGPAMEVDKVTAFCEFCMFFEIE